MITLFGNSISAFLFSKSKLPSCYFPEISNDEYRIPFVTTLLSSMTTNENITDKYPSILGETLPMTAIGHLDRIGRHQERSRDVGHKVGLELTA